MARQATKKGKSRIRRDEVLKAARKLFYRKGYKGTSIEHIAGLAGYSKRTVYLDFKNKDELFITVGAEGLEQLYRKLHAIPLHDLPLEESIERFIDVYIEFSRRKSNLFRLIFSEATPSIISNCSKPLRKRVAELERACLGTVVNWANKAIEEKSIPEIDPWEVAGIAVGSTTGIILLSMGGSQTVFSKETLESLCKQTIWLMFHGLKHTMSIPSLK